MLELFSSLSIATHLTTIGYLGILLIIFAESGLFFGFFLPGDSLLFTAGLLASQGVFNIYLLILCIGFAAILGDTVGFWFGRYIGPRLFTKEDSFFFHTKHITRTALFYKKYGPKAIVLGRFIPIVRTFVPILAGVGNMRYPLFLTYNIIGGLLWGVGLTTLGYVLGTKIKNIDAYLLPIILGIIILSLIPIIFEYYMSKKTRA